VKDNGSNKCLWTKLAVELKNSQANKVIRKEIPEGTG